LGIGCGTGRFGAWRILDALIGKDITCAAGLIMLWVLLAGIGAGTGTVTAGAGCISAYSANPCDVSGSLVGAAGLG